MGWTPGVRFPVGVRDFSLNHSVQADSGAHPASYPKGTRDSSQEAKRAGHELDHSLPCRAEIKNSGALLPFPLTSSSLIKYRDKLIFTFLVVYDIVSGRTMLWPAIGFKLNEIILNSISNLVPSVIY
jgi:hypothetical protein